MGSEMCTRDSPITGPCGATYSLASITETYKKPPKEPQQKLEEIREINPIISSDDLDSDPIILDDDDANTELGDELLEEDDDESVSLEELTDVPSENDDN